MSIVDAHHHLVDPAARDYPWIAGRYGGLLRRWDIGDLRAVTATAGVGRTVLVQTVADTAETLDFLAVAACSGGLVAGVVGWVDLTAEDPASELDQLLGRDDAPWLVGLRHPAHDEPDPDWLGPAV